MIFERHYKLWGYTVSHGFLLLRSLNNRENLDKEDWYNIDIEFWAVVYIELPSIPILISSIRNITNNIPSKLNIYKDEYGLNVYEILVEKQMFYIVSGGCSVNKNNWINADRISNPNLKHDQLLLSI